MAYNDILAFFQVFFTEGWENAPVMLVMMLICMTGCIGFFIWYAVDWIGYAIEKAWEFFTKVIADVFRIKDRISHQ